MLRAAACVGESDHHALALMPVCVPVWHGPGHIQLLSCQAVRETLDLRRGYGPLFPRTVNDSNKGSNGPAGSSFIAKRGEGSA